MSKAIYLIILLLFGCKSIEFDKENSNKRCYEIISKEREILKISKIKTFNTDTLINFKTEVEIIGLFGKPDKRRIVGYKYPSPNILWILEGPIPKVKECDVLMLEWHYIEKKLFRVVLFIELKKKWISITNILYDDSLEY